MRDANFGWDYPPGCSGPPEDNGPWEYRCHNPKCEEFGNLVEAGEQADCDECGEELIDADELVPERCDECHELIDDCTCPETCDACNGSGEGMVDGSKCLKCGGSGVIPYVNEDDEDYDDRRDKERDDRATGDCDERGGVKCQ
jgi:hypothetical protein